MSLTALPSTHMTSRSQDDPDNDWDDHAQTLGAAILYFVLMCIVTFCLFCLVGSSPILLDRFEIFYLLISLAMIGLLEVVLFSLTIETDLSEMPLWCRRILHMANILFFIFSALFSYLRSQTYDGGGLYAEHYSFAWIGSYSFLISAAVFYILCAIFSRILQSCCCQKSFQHAGP